MHERNPRNDLGTILYGWGGACVRSLMSSVRLLRFALLTARPTIHHIKWRLNMLGCPIRWFISLLLTVVYIYIHLYICKCIVGCICVMGNSSQLWLKGRCIRYMQYTCKPNIAGSSRTIHQMNVRTSHHHSKPSIHPPFLSIYCKVINDSAIGAVAAQQSYITTHLLIYSTSE